MSDDEEASKTSQMKQGGLKPVASKTIQMKQGGVETSLFAGAPLTGNDTSDSFLKRGRGDEGVVGRNL